MEAGADLLARMDVQPNLLSDVVHKPRILFSGRSSR